MRRALPLVATVLLAAAGARAQAPASPSQDLFERAADAYRRGSYDEAALAWQALLDDPALVPEDRARVALGLGNAAWRGEHPMEALGWYTLAARLDPASEDARANRELARSQQGLAPAERGDLRSTFARLGELGRPHERRWAVLGALALLALALAGEALRGGAAWRRAALGAALVLAAAALPWLAGMLPRARGDLLVLAAPAAPLRSEPRPSAAPIGQAEAGQEVARVDALPGWVRVETADGTRGWVADSAVFALDR